MAMNTRKQVTEARRKSIQRLKSGVWKKEFDKTVIDYKNEEDQDKKESLMSSLIFKSKAWGIRNFPELEEYALEEISKLETGKVEKLTPAQFVQRWKNKYRL